MTNSRLQRNEYFLGLDLGRKQDHSALVILERSLRAMNTRYVDAYTQWQSFLSVRYAKQWKLGAAYGQVASEVAEVFRKVEAHGRSVLVFDQTGVGDAVDEMIREHLRGATVEGVVLTQELKRDMYAALETALEQGRLKISERCAASRELKDELLKVEIRRIGLGYKYGAFEKDTHDDLVMALAIACWRERIGRRGANGGERLPGF
jgi:phage FluMu gp28-like protein